MQSTNIFTHQEKKALVSQIEKIKKKKHYKEIFKLIHNDNNKYTLNDNGVYININTLSDSTLQQIKNYIDSIDTTKNVIPVPKEYVPFHSETSDIKPRLNTLSLTDSDFISSSNSLKN